MTRRRDYNTKTPPSHVWYINVLRDHVSCDLNTKAPDWRSNVLLTSTPWISMTSSRISTTTTSRKRRKISNPSRDHGSQNASRRSYYHGQKSWWIGFLRGSRSRFVVTERLAILEIGTGLTGTYSQIEVIEDQTGSMDPKTNFKLIILQTELERFKFLVRSFLRARIAKVWIYILRKALRATVDGPQIDAHPLHYQTHELNYTLLSQSETQYLQAHQTLLTTHYQTSFLSQFPQSLQRLDDTAGGISMIDRPDAEKAVFVRVLRDCGAVTVEGADVRCEFRKGDVWVIRWNAVKEKVQLGDVELIWIGQMCIWGIARRSQSISWVMGHQKVVQEGCPELCTTGRDIQNEIWFMEDIPNVHKIYCFVTNSSERIFITARLQAMNISPRCNPILNPYPF